MLSPQIYIAKFDKTLTLCSMSTIIVSVLNSTDTKNEV